MPDRYDLPALIGSRICHDLISPIGAIGNGVELLMMGPAGAGPELALVAESVTNANARIRFFRLAFGAAGRDQRIARAEVAAILADLTRGGRLQADLAAPTDLSRAEAKLVCLAFLCLETAMAYGGRISIARTDQRWIATGRAPRLKVDPELWEVLSNPAAGSAISPAQVQFALLPDEAARHGRRLTVEVRDGEIRLGF
jgi:histidine phosphotransferase ChpT